MKHKFQIIETYRKIIEVNARTEEKAKKLAKDKAKEIGLGKEYSSDKTIEFSRDVIPENKPTYWERLWQITEETNVNWYQSMMPWQRKDLTKEELFQYAEEMRQALERIFDIAYEFERSQYE